MLNFKAVGNKINTRIFESVFMKVTQKSVITLRQRHFEFNLSFQTFQADNIILYVPIIKSCKS